MQKRVGGGIDHVNSESSLKTETAHQVRLEIQVDDVHDKDRSLATNTGIVACNDLYWLSVC